ncbi:GTPase ObgE [Desulfovibrio sp. OttesenSCG-928-C06]|nr:GTPase ObgE [Desulfovibrio sp. OttesenSCG-928-C06]
MRFIDEANITLRAGKGGSGCVAFRREKFIEFGGPNGGDGGDGGNIILKASSKLMSLYDFRLKRNYEAENGRPGQGSQMHGRNGKDLILELPVGTQVFLIGEDGEKMLTDLPEAGKEVRVARGGRGGKGNEFFKSATNQAPRFAQPGEEGEFLQVRLELKILADCGLVGLPNAGKSTFISTVSAAKPKIAPYPFTTLVPNLGVMLHDGDYDKRMVIADIPGLIEGASLGVGLGHRFLKHVERTRFLVHILSAEDIDPDSENPWEGFDLINEELRLFDESLAERGQLEVVNKIDLLDDEQLEKLKNAAKKSGRVIFFISALEKRELEPLVEEMWRLQEELNQHDPLQKSRRRQVVEDVSDSDDDSDADFDDDFDGDGTEVVWSK